MTDTAICPACDTAEGWSVLVTTQLGVRLPGDSKAAEDEQTMRELRVCGGCGVCYDPVLAGDDADETIPVSETPEAAGRNADGAIDRGADETTDRSTEAASDEAGTAEEATNSPVPDARERVESLDARVNRLEAAVAVLAEVQAGTADAASGVDEDRVRAVLAEAELLGDAA